MLITQYSKGTWKNILYSVVHGQQKHEIDHCMFTKNMKKSDKLNK